RLLADFESENRGAQGAFRAVDVDVRRVSFNFTVREEKFLFITHDVCRDDGSDLDDPFTFGSLTYFCVLQELFEVADPRLHHALFFLRSVVTAVFLEVSLFPRNLDAARNFSTANRREFL